MIVGYARVSTDGQTLDAQQAPLAAAGAGQVFSEKISGVVTERKALARAIEALGPGGTMRETVMPWHGFPVYSSKRGSPGAAADNGD